MSEPRLITICESVPTLALGLLVRSLRLRAVRARFQSCVVVELRPDAGYHTRTPGAVANNTCARSRALLPSRILRVFSTSIASMSAVLSARLVQSFSEKRYFVLIYFSVIRPSPSLNLATEVGDQLGADVISVTPRSVPGVLTQRESPTRPNSLGWIGRTIRARRRLQGHGRANNDQALSF